MIKVSCWWRTNNEHKTLQKHKSASKDLWHWLQVIQWEGRETEKWPTPNWRKYLVIPHKCACLYKLTEENNPNMHGSSQISLSLMIWHPRMNRSNCWSGEPLLWPTFWSIHLCNFHESERDGFPCYYFLFFLPFLPTTRKLHITSMLNIFLILALAIMSSMVKQQNPQVPTTKSWQYS